MPAKWSTGIFADKTKDVRKTSQMKIIRRYVVLPLLLLFASTSAQAGPDLLKLPLTVHLIDMEMVRVHERPGTEPLKTVMDMPLSVEAAGAIIDQVNQIWAPAGIEWVIAPKQGGGGILAEKASGGRFPEERLKQLADIVVARDRDSRMRYMDLIFPALADPANNERIGADGRFNEAKAEKYHLYLFPYVGQTLQGTARNAGTFAIAGVFSDKPPIKKGHPKRRPSVIPSEPGTPLALKDFPAAGALSATIAHELGHNLSLKHVDEGMKDNLMKGHVKIRLSPKQIKKARTQAAKGPLIEIKAD